MCEVRSRKETTKNKPKMKKYNDTQQKEMDCDEPPDEKT
jgi:hypothetical protein